MKTQDLLCMQTKNRKPNIPPDVDSMLCISRQLVGLQKSKNAIRYNQFT